MSRRRPLPFALAALALAVLVCVAVGSSAQPKTDSPAATGSVPPTAGSSKRAALDSPPAVASDRAADAGCPPDSIDLASRTDDSEEAREPEVDPLPPDEHAFLTDLVALTSTSHRLAGSDAGAAAARYIEGRLRSMGFEQVMHLDMPVWRERDDRCELRIAGRSLRLYPLRPNVVVNPATGPEGITAPFFYVGPGTAREYADRDVDGAIVGLDYDSFDAWELAFAYGASAVVFIGDGTETPRQPKVLGVPANRLRFYLPRGELGGLDLGRDYPAATLTSRVGWEQRRGRNLVVRVEGTDPDFAPDRVEPEAMVLAADYDSYGVVPELSPGARGAANVAALLEAADRFRRSPPRRDVWFLFLDNESRALQGAREIYSVLAGEGKASSRLVTELSNERLHVSAMRTLLQREGIGFEPSSQEAVPGVGVGRWLAITLRREADFARDDVRRLLQIERLKQRDGLAVDQSEIDRLEARALAWDEIRRAMHEGKLRTFVQRQRASLNAGESSAQRFTDLFRELRTLVLDRFDRRLDELELERAVAEQRVELRRGLGYGRDGATPSIVLHVNYALSDRGPRWGIVAGDYTARLFPWRETKPEGDSPGFYGGVLNAVRSVVPRPPPRLDARTLDEPTLGTSFAPGAFVSSGSVAGAYGVYNVSLMTGHDSRPRDGHPADTLERLDWWNLHAQAAEATRVLLDLADSAELSLPVVFSPFARNKFKGWARGQATGDYASQVVSGSLSEDRPAEGALVAVWPGKVGAEADVWLSLEDATCMPAFDPIALEPVDMNGRFHLLSFRDDRDVEVVALGAMFDEQGRVVALSSGEKLVHKLSDSIRVNLLHGTGGSWTFLPTHEAPPGTLRLLKASSNAAFRDNRAIFGQLDGQGFFFISDQVGAFRLKLFQPMGPVALGEFGRHDAFGKGVAPARFEAGLAMGKRTATDLFELNESRLSTLRAHGVTHADLEVLHARARRVLEHAVKTSSVAAREAGFARSASLSHRVYLPLRAAMDDLVHAVVVLLLLSIPFAFAMERLLICATTIYGRIGGFAVMFLVTFGLLYWMHPGFAIASTPIIVFLAFAIVLLSSLVIFIVIRKFKTELRAMQGQQAAVHDAGVSHAATMLAAVNMGMSTMRRRPTRTLLTTVTVVMLTFTVLLFASFNRTVGVRSIYEGPADPRTAPDILVRKLDYSAVPSGVLEMLRGEGAGEVAIPNYWFVRKQVDDPRTNLARVDSGETLSIDAVMGIDPTELDRWPELAAALATSPAATTAEQLDGGAVYLPPIARDALHLDPGDDVLLAGRRARVAGTFDAAKLQRLRHLDQQSVLPVDFQDPTSVAFRPETTQGGADDDMLLSDGPDRDFVHLSGDQVVLASADLVRSLGGSLHSISIYAADKDDAIERARELAEVVVMPVWAAGPEGAERLVLTVLTEVTGGLALVVPLLLGGLIVFGTLLGSISDREKEIYTFSALGLSPTHVGVLFLAEAAVYAIVGGVGGQLLAQFAGLTLSALANAGVVQVPSINFSSSNALFAIGIVMATVLVSAIYPATRAAKSANPGLERTWRMPPADGDEIRLVFPFTVSAYDITGVVSFIAEHFRGHDDAGLGSFAASNVGLDRTAEGNLVLRADLALAPFDLGVTESFELTAVPSSIEGVDEVSIVVRRLSGAGSDWYRANRTFMRDLRRQFLLWRTLTHDVIEQYRLETLQALGSLDSKPCAAEGGASG